LLHQKLLRQDFKGGNLRIDNQNRAIYNALAYAVVMTSLL